jgi:hypothetical protein
MWISVRDRLPSRDRDVLAYIAQHRQVVVAQWDGATWNINDYDLDEAEWYLFEAPAPITHWQALPAPPSLIA